MLEAVSTVLQTAPFVRQNNEQISSSDSFAANPDRVQRTPPQAPYISPYIYLDVNYDKAVLQIRNGETGDVEDQFPSEASLQASARQAARRAAVTGQQGQTATPQTQEQSAQAFVQQTSPDDAQQQAAAITAQQQAAFQAAAQSGNSNAGNVEVFA